MFIKDMFLHSKIKCGEFYLPASEVDLFCAKSVRKLLSKEIGDDRFFGEHGSVTLAKINEKYLAVFTGHQINNPDFHQLDDNFSENYIIPSLQPTIKNLPVETLIHCTSHENEEFRDIVAFQIDESDADFIREKVYFYSIKKPTGAKIHHHFFVGCPRLNDNFVINDDCTLEEIKNRVLIKDCVLDQTFESHARFFRRFEHETTSSPVDGLSGGAIFVLIEDEAGYEICLDSVIVRANEHYLHGISVQLISEMS